MASKAPLDIPGAEAKLRAYLQAHAPELGALKEASKFSVGQSNPTYKLAMDAGDFVLRTQPLGDLLKSAHAVDREHRVMQALGQSDVPVPPMVLACEDLEVLGVKWFVMGLVQGSTLTDPQLPDHDAAMRRHIYEAQLDVLARLATTDPGQLGLSDYGRPSGYLERQLHVWTRQYRASETQHMPAMEELISKLPGMLPLEQHKAVVVHGDFRLDNLLIDGQGDVQAVIDWELSTLGPPLVDLSYWCTMLRMDQSWPIAGLGGVNLSALGIPNEQELVAQFAHKTGLEIPDDWHVWVAFHCFRFAAILQGIAKRVSEGNASADNAANVATQAKPMAELGAEILTKGAH